MPVFLFWLFGTLIVYTYAGYPAAIWAAARLRRPPESAGAVVSKLPRVSVCIAVHNEAPRLPAKIRNLQELDYPAELLEIILSSDGSTDGTAELVSNIPGLRFIENPRAGKTAALSAAVEAASGEIVVFADVRQALSANAIRALVQRLEASDVGAVSGLLVYRRPQNSEARGADLYWRYEAWIRRQEARSWSIIGATGALYAMRRTDIRMPAAGTVLDDFEIPIQVLRHRRRIVLEESAIAFDEAARDPGSERRRKIRTLAGNFQSFRQQAWLFLPWKNPVWWQFLSHKVFRLLVPYLMVGTLVCSLLATNPFYRWVTLAQLSFYASGIAGLVAPRLRALRPVNICSVFLDLNMAAVQGLLVYLSGRVGSVWQTAPSPPRST